MGGSNGHVLRVLAVAESAATAERWLGALFEAGHSVLSHRVGDPASLALALDSGAFDVVLGGDQVPGLPIVEALRACRGRNGGVPFVVMSSGPPDEGSALAHLRAGAADVVPEYHLSRLSSAVEREVRPGAGRRTANGKADAHGAEARWDLLVQNALYGMYRSDLRGRFLLANPALASMLGYDSPAELLRVTSGAHVFRDPRELDLLVARARAADHIQGVEVAWVRRDGRLIFVRLSGRAVRGADGTLEGLELLAEDVTERRSLELQVQRAQKMEAIGRLAGGIAHDFNNLLVAILGYGDILAESLGEDDPRRRYVEQIQRAGDRASGLTRQLLAFSRRQVIDPRVLAPNDVVREVAPMLRRLLGEDIRFETDLDPALPRTRVDRGQLEQVVMNLAVNARDAMPRGGTLTISTRGTTLGEGGAIDTDGGPLPPGRYVVLAVADTGTGMSADVISHLFEPFFTTKEEGKGTGLGLSTAYAIVRNAGGSVSVASRLGAGSTLEVWLPATDDPADAPDVPAPAPPPAATGETILLVEDEPAVRELSRTILDQEGYRVLVASDATEALRLLEGPARDVRLLVTDLVLPDLSGLELAQHVLERAPDVRVLLTSGYTAHSIDGATLEGLRASFLQKPFRVEALVRSVRLALAGQEARAT